MHLKTSSALRPDFTWGVAAASYQIEGAASADGKGPSIWDMFCRRGDRVWLGQTGDVACDHFHRYQEDVGLMQSLGVQAYRMSVSWPRVMPKGRGEVNLAGLDFYDRLVDALLAAGIDPWVTLYHWDLPYALYCEGGWLNREIAAWFADYAAVVVDRLSDRVTHWITLNEPQVFIGLGLETGRHAPGDKLGLAEVLRAGHNALLAHGMAVQQIRARARKPAQIGWAPAASLAMPASPRPEDLVAAKQAMFDFEHRGLLTGRGDETQVWSNTWWMDPVFFGHYPEDARRCFGPAFPPVEPGDMATIRQPLDFFGANIYHGFIIGADAAGRPEQRERPLGYPQTAFHWPVAPEVMYWGLKLLQERYRLPIVVTENGISCRDWVSLDGQVHDPNRIDFLARYLGALVGAAEDGVDVRGYFHWSILDNFEWAEGYRERFGLIHVDYPTQKRTIKDSGHWYAETIRNRGAQLYAWHPTTA